MLGELLRKHVDADWGSGDQQIDVLPDRLIVRQPAAVHRRIDEFLNQLGVAHSEAAAGGFAGGQF